MNTDQPRLILVTGASGAGLSTALKILEDCGLAAVDNLPLAMIDTLVALEVETGGRSLAIGLTPEQPVLPSRLLKRWCEICAGNFRTALPSFIFPHRMTIC